MGEAGRGRRLVARTALTLLALAFATDARATCTLVAGQSLFATGGSTCAASGPTYDPATGPALWSDGVGSSPPTPPPASTINLTAPGITITTMDTLSFGLYATDGGVIAGTSANGLGGVTTEGATSPAIFADGAGSSITVTLIAPKSGSTVLTEADDSTGVLSAFGSSVTLTGGSVTTEGNGAAGLLAFFGSISATGTKITTEGTNDGAGIQSYGIEVTGTGASVTLTNGAVMTSGVGSDGVVAEGSGTATLNGTMTTLVTTTNDRAVGLFAVGGATIDATAPITISTGSTDGSTGAGADGVYASGTSSSTPATPSTITIEGLASITTSGDSAVGVQADLGGQVTLSGGSTATPPNTVTTTGAGAIGLYALSGGTIDISGPTKVSTSGATSTTTGLVAYGVNANGLGSTVTLGAATSVTTTGPAPLGSTPTGSTLITAD